MLGRWLRKVVVAVFGAHNGARERVNPTLIRSERARQQSANVSERVRPHIDRSRELITAYEAKDAALRGRS